MELFRHYLTSVQTRASLIPTILSKEKIFDVVEAFSGTLPESIEQVQHGDFSQVFLYGIAEEKKHFDIATVRKLIQDMSLKPYEGKNLYILMDIDTATLEAQNALLKILEECPEYAMIVLGVTNPEGLIETIHSRCLLIQENTYHESLTDEIKKMIQCYYHGDTIPFTRYLFTASYSREEALSILQYSYQFCPAERCQLYEDAIIDILRGIETAKYILDTIYIIPNRV